MAQNEARVDLWAMIKAPDGVVSEICRVRTTTFRVAQECRDTLQLVLGED